MGVEDYLLSSTVNGIVAQRLVRRLCRHCRKAYRALPEMVEELKLDRYAASAGEVMLYHAGGCDNCGHSGYFGRLVVTEVLVMTDGVRQLVMRHATASEIQQQATKEGMDGMYQDGIRKAVLGLTTLEEVMRVTEEA